MQAEMQGFHQEPHKKEEEKAFKREKKVSRTKIQTSNL